MKKSSLISLLTIYCMSEKWVIFDAMGVIFKEGHDLHELLIPFVQIRKENMDPGFIEEIYRDTSLGKLSSEELWDRLGFFNEYPEIEKKYLDTCLTIDPEFKSVANELKSKHSLALLSNDVKEWSNYLCKKFELNDLFSVIVISGDVGLRKPDSKIFKLILDKIKVPPECCVFIDDNLHNLNAASEFGIKTIRFVRSKVKTPFCSEFEISSFTELNKVLKNFHGF